VAVLNPLSDDGRHGMRELGRDDAGIWRASVGDLFLGWRGAGRARVVRDGRHHALHLDLALLEGAEHDLVLEISAHEPGTPPEPEAAWRETEQAWHDRVADFSDTVAPRDAAHAYAVMSGMTSAAGGMVAAATTSLPERAEHGRN
jgi:hypothetical protein